MLNKVVQVFLYVYCERTKRYVVLQRTPMYVSFFAWGLCCLKLHFPKPTSGEAGFKAISLDRGGEHQEARPCASRPPISFAEMAGRIERPDATVLEQKKVFLPWQKSTVLGT